MTKRVTRLPARAGRSWAKAGFVIVAMVIWAFPLSGQDTRPRWTMDNEGGIVWTIGERLPHADHIEMSGEAVSTVIRYGVDADSTLHYTRSVVWPMLRTIPNNTHASLTRRFGVNPLEAVLVNGQPPAKEKVKKITLNGLMTIYSDMGAELQCVRTLFPSATLPAYCERYELRNASDRDIRLEVPSIKTVYHTDSATGVYGSYRLTIESTGAGHYLLSPGQHMTFSLVIKGERQDRSPIKVDAAHEEAGRRKRVGAWWGELILDTPNDTLDRAFAFAKIRAAESIYRTKGGLMHGPGGEAYYAAIWANDQGEYIGPFFPFLGYDVGNEASLNAYLQFARFMNADYKPLPSSIIAEGTDIWNGAGDRGDATMIAYGAGRYALAMGDREQARRLWPLISWCLEYCRRKLTAEGVVASDADELEGRFPAGKANLCTSSLYYDGLLSAAYLADALGKPPSVSREYRRQAKKMHQAIDRYFGGKVEGFDTYRYFAGNDVLRAWICIPLTMGIFDRKQGTIDALFSPRLWSQDGLLTQAGTATYWDRSTLYALRGVLAAGETARALPFLRYYSARRLLGEHVPYPIEAYPEGHQRHLSAESGLYCRVFTEGLFGIRPTGLHRFILRPRLPQGWRSMSLKRVHGFGTTFDLSVRRENGQVVVVVHSDKGNVVRSLPRDGTLEIRL